MELTSAQRRYLREQFEATYGPLVDWTSETERARWHAWLGIFTLGFHAGLAAQLIRGGRCRRKEGTPMIHHLLYRVLTSTLAEIDWAGRQLEWVKSPHITQAIRQHMAALREAMEALRAWLAAGYHPVFLVVAALTAPDHATAQSEGTDDADSPSGTTQNQAHGTLTDPPAHGSGGYG